MASAFALVFWCTSSSTLVVCFTIALSVFCIWPDASNTVSPAGNGGVTTWVRKSANSACVTVPPACFSRPQYISLLTHVGCELLAALLLPHPAQAATMARAAARVTSRTFFERARIAFSFFVRKTREAIYQDY